MEDQLKQYLKEFVETLKQGGEFAQEQLPLFVKEYLTWGFWEAIAYATIFLIASITLGGLSYYLFNKGSDYEPDSYMDDMEFGLYMGSGASCALGVLFGAFMVSEIMTAIKITVAPRVYLIENLMNLL